MTWLKRDGCATADEFAANRREMFLSIGYCEEEATALGRYWWWGWKMLTAADAGQPFGEFKKEWNRVYRTVLLPNRKRWQAMRKSVE
jgi:hypothetical protein